MASRAILRRKRCFFNSLGSSACSLRGFSTFEDGTAFWSSGIQSSSLASSHSPTNNNDGKEGNMPLMKKVELSSFPTLQNILGNNSCRVAASGYGTRWQGYMFPLGLNWVRQSMRYLSTVTAGQPDNNVDTKEGNGSKQVKEASPEDCDLAVEGLTSAKAKIKVKQHEYQKGVSSVMKQLWAKLLGIGPALRVVASMSREDWANKLSHWKDEFKSTMQRYWLGTKLLWADIRICSRLLFKLAKGKSLSRRERQQLTRTTADIFRAVETSCLLPELENMEEQSRFYVL